MASTYTPIATYTVSGSSTNKVTFSSIPSTYTDLVLVTSARSVVAQNTDFIYTQPNADTGTTKSTTRLVGDGTSANSYRTTNDAYLQFGLVTGASATSGIFAVSIANFQNYANTTTYKTVISRGSDGNAGVAAFAGLWRSTSAITSLDIYAGGLNNYVAGSTFTLYGVKSA